MIATPESRLEAAEKEIENLHNQLRVQEVNIRRIVEFFNDTRIDMDEKGHVKTGAHR